jgi:hypothetical protein
MTGTLDKLRDLRPEPTWSSADQAHLLDSVLDSPRRRDRADIRLAAARPRRRGAVTIAAVATIAAAAVVIPAVLPADAPGSASPAAAAALHRLAHVAVSSPADDAGPTQFRHMIVRERQVGPRGQASDTERMEGWTAADGRLWRRDITAYDTGRRVVDTYLFSAGDNDTAYPSPSYLASLPTEVGALQNYLRGHVSGSASKDEAVFVAVGDMLRGGFAPADLRAAAVGVLARTDHVRLGSATQDSTGRPAEVFEFVDGTRRPGDVESLYFDPSTAQVVEERTDASDLQFSSTVLTADVTNSVPEYIRRSAVPQ